MGVYDNIQDVDEFKHIKELFRGENTKLRTELTDKQIKAINLLRSMSMMFGSSVLENHIDDFLELQISRNRASRKEYVDSIKGAMQHEENKQGGFKRWLTG